MSVVTFAYKSIRKLWLILLYHPYCKVITMVMMLGNGVNFKHFKTRGIPIIKIDRKGSCIILDDNLVLNNKNSGNTIGYASRCTLVASDGAHLHIYENVGMSQTAICAMGADISIGSNTILGGGVKIYSSDFHSLFYLDRREQSGFDKKHTCSASISIGKDCFIGAGSTILKGVTIGDRTIIGAGSVVTRSIPSDCIAAGNPCKIIRNL